MALTTAADLVIVLSGGSLNSNPNLSIGGSPSATLINSGILNNLFDDVTSDESENGAQDHRAIYFANDGDTTIFNLEIFITDEVENGSNILIGTENRDELQRITIEGNITGGSVTFAIDSITFIVNTPISVNVDTWATEFQNKIRAITSGGEILYPDVVVTGTSVSGFFVFDISFEGRNGQTNQEPIVVITNNLTVSSGTSTISVVTVQNGAPINTIAQSLATESEVPAAVNFFYPIESSPIAFAALRSADIIPIWIQRTTTAGAGPLANDGVTLRFRAESLDPSLFS